MLHEAREDIKNLRNKSLPNSTVQRYTALASVLPMDSLAAEIEGTFRKGLDTPPTSEYKWVCVKVGEAFPHAALGVENNTRVSMFTYSQYVKGEAMLSSLGYQSSSWQALFARCRSGFLTIHTQCFVEVTLNEPGSTLTLCSREKFECFISLSLNKQNVKEQ